MITFIVFMLNAIIFVLSRKSISYKVLYNNKYVDDYFMLFPTPFRDRMHDQVLSRNDMHILQLIQKRPICMFQSVEIYIAKQEYKTKENWNIFGRINKSMKIV